MTEPRLIDARQLAEETGLPYRTIAGLAGRSPAPFTSVRLSKRVLLIDPTQFREYLARRTHRVGE